jgi:hypothetical protein
MDKPVFKTTINETSFLHYLMLHNVLSLFTFVCLLFFLIVFRLFLDRMRTKKMTSTTIFFSTKLVYESLNNSLFFVEWFSPRRKNFLFLWEWPVSKPSLNPLKGCTFPKCFVWRSDRSTFLFIFFLVRISARNGLIAVYVFCPYFVSMSNTQVGAQAIKRPGAVEAI